MKEIKRIHIAKVPYDMEIEAKKELEVYLKALETYSHDDDILTEVEIRITEILEERGVKRGGVITHKDVDALKHQLGEPREFMSEDNTSPTVISDEDMTESSRKLFRDTDHAVFGGVLAGIAAFFKVNPALVRILFVIIALASFGTALLVYIVLWIAVPSASTATDKLQMAGRSVTVNAIREINETDAGKRGDGGRSIHRTVTRILGIGSVIGAVTAAMATMLPTMAVLLGHQHVALQPGTGARYFMGAFALAVVSGILLTVLFILTAYASFTQKVTRRVLISICVVIVAGLLSFGGAIGLVQYASLQRSYYVDANTHTETVVLPGETSNITALTADTHGVLVKYFPTSGKPYAVIHAVVNDTADLPDTTVKVVGATATLQVTATQKSGDICGAKVIWCYDTRPTLEIHGPILTLLNAEKDSMVTYQPSEQPSLAIHAGDNVSVEVLPGSIDAITVVQGLGSSVSLAQATVKSLTVSTKSGSNTEAGTVRSLSVRDDGSCPAPLHTARVSAWKVTDGIMDLNGESKAVKTSSSGCTLVVIEGVNQS